MSSQYSLTRTVGANTHTFTFAEGMVQHETDSTESEPNVIESPGLGPASNVANQFGGVSNVITLSINLYDTSTSVVTGTSAPTITTKEQMKYWLKSIPVGSNTALTFQGPGIDYSLQGDGTGTSIPEVSVTIPGAWITTKAYIASISFDKDKSEPSIIECSITLHIVGS